MKSKFQIVAVIFAVALIAGCASEEERYQRNLANTYVPKWVHLAPGDKEQIVRVVSRATQQQCIGMVYVGKELWVFTGFPSGTTPDDFTAFTVRKENGKW